MKKLKIFLFVFTIVIVSVGALIWWQYDNIKTAYYSFKFDNEQIEELTQKQNEEINTYLNENTGLNVRPSTVTEEKLHQAKLITDEEFVRILTGKTDVKTIFGVDVNYDETTKEFVGESGVKLTAEELSTAKAEIAGNEQSASAIGAVSDSPVRASASGDNDTPKKDTGSSSKVNDSGYEGTTHSPAGQSDKQNEVSDSGNAANNKENKPSGQPGSSVSGSNERASEYIAQMYVLKSSFESQLDGLYGDAISYYSNMTPEEKKNAKTEIVKTYYPQATALESQCDASVESILSKLTAELEAAGEDTSIVNTIRQQYGEEKSLKKAYYINLVK